MKCFVYIMARLWQFRYYTLRLNVFIANIKQGVEPQVLPTLVTALPLQSTYITLNSDINTKFYDRINF